MRPDTSAGAGAEVRTLASNTCPGAPVKFDVRWDGVLSLAVEPLSSHLELLPLIKQWFEEEWPSHYRKGAGDAGADALSYSRSEGLPRGFVAFAAGRPCGFAALKSQPFLSCPHRAPWAGAAYVLPSMRRRGIGAALLSALEAEAAALGCKRVLRNGPIGVAAPASRLEPAGSRGA